MVGFLFFGKKSKIKEWVACSGLVISNPFNELMVFMKHWHWLLLKNLIIILDNFFNPLKYKHKKSSCLVWRLV